MVDKLIDFWSLVDIIEEIVHYKDYAILICYVNQPGTGPCIAPGFRALSINVIAAPVRDARGRGKSR